MSRVDDTVKRYPDKQRKTQHTVEAISLDDSRSWIGINQVMVARWAPLLAFPQALYFFMLQVVRPGAGPTNPLGTNPVSLKTQQQKRKLSA